VRQKTLKSPATITGLVAPFAWCSIPVRLTA